MAAMMVLGGCSDACRNRPVARAAAADGRHDVILFQRDCGASTGFSTQISIVDPGEAPAGTGNVFRADDGHGAAKAASWGGPWADMRWLDPDHLIVRYDARSRIFAMEERPAGVSVSYRKVVR